MPDEAVEELVWVVLPTDAVLLVPVERVALVVTVPAVREAVVRVPVPVEAVERVPVVVEAVERVAVAVVRPEDAVERVAVRVPAVP